MPDADDVAVFALDDLFSLILSDATISFNANVVNAATRITAGHATFNLTGRTYILESNSGIFSLSDPPPLFISGDDAHLTVTDGTVSARNDGAVFVGGTGAAGFFPGSVDSGHLEISTEGRLNAGTMRLHLSDALLSVHSGGDLDSTTAFIGDGAGTNRQAVISGDGSTWDIESSLNVGVGGRGTLTIEDGADVTTGVVSSLGHGIAMPVRPSGTGTVVLTGLGSTWNSGQLLVGRSGTGTVVVSDRATLTTGSASLGFAANTIGDVTVSGAGTTWNVANTIQVGQLGTGRLRIDLGAGVSSAGAAIAPNIGSEGSVVVSDFSSIWNVAGDFSVGGRGIGSLSVLNGAQVTVTGGDVFIGRSAGARGAAIVSGNNSLWTADRIFVGGTDLGGTPAPGGNATLSIGPGATSQSNVIHLLGPGTINLNGGTLQTGAVNDLGGTFNFNSGQLQLESSDFTVGSTGLLGPTLVLKSEQTISAVNAVVDAGALLRLEGGLLRARSTGQVINNGAIQLASVTGGIDAATLQNHGLLSGAGRITAALANEVDGEVRAAGDQLLLFNGGPHGNAGQITLVSGGTVEFNGALTNESTGFIAGRGTLIANDGLRNVGTLAFSGGFTDVLGDVTNQADGVMITSGGGTTTFFDDVTHNGTEIRTSVNSNTVFFGVVSGSGSFTGTGTVYFEGDLRPGNSPALVAADGDVVFGSLLTTQIEIGGLLPGGGHDQLAIAGSATLDGTLELHLINGFDPAFGEVFEIIDVAGTLIGTFGGLGEGAIFTADRQQFAISYLGGDGNDVTLTVVPEPASWAIVMLGGLATLARRRRER